MALLGRVESRSLFGRTFHAAIILVLTLGGLTMVYPFVVMLSGSVRSEVDEVDLDLVPGFWTSETPLFRKFVETKYNQNLAIFNRARLASHFSFRDVEIPAAAGDPELADAMQAYLSDPELPHHWQVLGGIYGSRTVPENLRELRERLSIRFDGDLDALGRDAGTPVSSWQAIIFGIPDWASRRYERPVGALYEIYDDMLEESDPAERQLVSLSGMFLSLMVYPNYGQTTTAAYNEAHTTHLESFSDFRLPATVPGSDEPTFREAWSEFVREQLHPSFIVVDNVDQAAYAAFQARDAAPTAEQDPVVYPLPDGRTWITGSGRAVYESFLQSQPIENLRIVGPEYEFGQDRMPAAMAALEARYVDDHAGALRWAYTTRNYINVLDELLFQGRALINTVIFCTLAIVLALFFNPLAAYALSHYQLPGTYKFLFVLMATMSFPPMVTLIPQFLLLRNFNLLNTFAALVVPMIINGYMIFLLKGFFDSLPKELYEAARIDGASEMHMFFNITMALSKPILAVLALGTFTSAYMAFLYPLIVAPDEDMWLISVWLYQFQQRSSSSAVYASVVIASIPTLIIFIFAQRTIMRGIVVPTEK